MAAPDASGPREGLILALFTVLALAASAFVLVSEESDAVDDPVQKAARGEIAALGELSLLRERNLRRALDTIEAGPYPLIETIHVSAGEVRATVRDADGIRRVLLIDAGFDTDERDFGTGTGEAVSPAEVDAGAPERMVREIVRRLGVSAEDVDYVTASFSNRATGPRWYMPLTTGPARERQWIAEADGGELRRPGEESR
ncbi:MAG: hypothetical protein WD844_09550 [Thermoleophilaceae bacterium]